MDVRTLLADAGGHRSESGAEPASLDIDFDPPVEPDAVDDETWPSETTTGRSPGTFPQSVASGDPSPTGVVLWTRLDPGAYREGEPLFVEVAEWLEGAEDPFGDGCCYRGKVPPETVEEMPEHDYTVKIDLDDELEPDTRYSYRFKYGEVASQRGRCKTLPGAGASPERVRFAVVTCQYHQNGHFVAHHHVADEDVDFLVDLGDSIYEDADDRYKGRGSKDYGRTYTLPSREPIVHGLDDYREIYRTYRSDESLQRALEAHTRIHVWDDHEFVNDIYWDYGRNAPRSLNHPKGDDPEFMRRLVRDALKVWWEYTPARVEYRPDAGRIKDVITLYRTFQFGDLLTLIATDERLHRTEPRPNWTERVRTWADLFRYWSERSDSRSRSLPATYLRRLADRSETWSEYLREWARRSDRWAGRYLPGWAAETVHDWLPERFLREEPTMLGEEQRRWFVGRVEYLSPERFDDRKHAPQTTWTVWANEVLTLPLPLLNHDAWDGYEAERKQLMQEIAGSRRMVSREEGGRGVRNLVTLTGDMHSYLAGYQRTKYPENTRVGVELMTPAITSQNLAEKLGVGDGWLGPLTECLFSAAVPRCMHNVEFFNGHRWGYSVVEFTQDGCTHRAYSVDKTREDPPEAEPRLLEALRIPVDELDIRNLPADRS